MAFPIIIYLLIFLSGFAALVYEVIWTRQLTLIFGVSILAISAALAAFMLGLAAGSYAWGRRTRRLTNPIRTYALLEAMIGLYALAFPWLHKLGQWAYTRLPVEHLPDAALLGIRFLLAIGLLLLPTILMGGTMPVLAQAFRSRFSQLGRTASLLYGLNTLGATLGAAAAGFLLLPSLGMLKSSLIAAGLNFFIAMVAFRLAEMGVAPAPAESVRQTAATTSPTKPAHRVRWLTTAVGVAGLVGLGYEIVWTKMLVLVLGNSTWAFSTSLAAYLISLALGSLLIAPMVDRRLIRESMVGGLLVAMAVFGGLSLLAFHWLIKGGLSGMAGSLTVLLMRHFVVACVIMLPAALCSGMIFPVSVKLAVAHAEETGHGFGRMLAVNTIGAVLGALIVATASLHWLGIQNSLLVLAALATIAAIPLLATPRDEPSQSHAVPLVTLALSILFLAFLFFPKPPLTQPPAGYEFTYYRESSIGTLAVYEHAEQDLRVFDINNITEVATDPTSMRTFKLMALLPYLLHEHPHDALVVTFGAGIVTGYLSQLDLANLTCVEINPHAADIGRIFEKDNFGVVSRTGVQLVIEDGRNFLQTRKQAYDIITADATHPTGADSWLLYTREYYQACREHLRPGGVFLQWLPMHALSPEHYQAIVATCKAVFPHVSLWFGGIQDRLGHTLLIAGDTPIRLDATQLRDRLAERFIQESLGEEGLTDLPSLSTLLIAADAQLEPFVKAASINTDDLPVTGFPRELPRASYAGEIFSLLSRVRSAPPITTADSLELSQTRRLNRWVRMLWQAAGKLHAKLPRSAAMIVKQRADDAARALPLPRLYRQLQQFLIDELYYLAQTTMDSLAAEDFLRATVILAPAFPEPYIALAYRLKMRRQFMEAEPVLRMATRNVPSARTFFELGTFYLELNRQKEALLAYEKALQHNSRAAIVHTNMGLIYARQRRWREAADAWRKAVELNPNDQIAKRNLQRLESLFPELRKKP
ncbi:MAG: fused MFS/spermidine synthase [candidate division KSB1 bacterium]|nr:fused MFS/spermidine synthase [candidate division KSB1 bacterium]